MDPDLNIKPKTLKLVQERAGNTLEAIGIDKDFLNRTPAAQQLRQRMDKWDYIKFKSSVQQKKWSLSQNTQVTQLTKLPQNQ
jgi:hypothetical protein